MFKKQVKKNFFEKVGERGYWEGLSVSVFWIGRKKKQLSEKGIWVKDGNSLKGEKLSGGRSSWSKKKKKGKLFASKKLGKKRETRPARVKTSC